MFFREERSNNAQSCPLTVTPLRPRRALCASYPKLFPTLSPGLRLCASLHRVRYCRYYAGYSRVWGIPRVVRVCIYQVVYTGIYHGGVYPAYTRVYYSPGTSGCTIAQVPQGVLYPGYTSGVLYPRVYLRCTIPRVYLRCTIPRCTIPRCTIPRCTLPRVYLTRSVPYPGCTLGEGYLMRRVVLVLWEI